MSARYVHTLEAANAGRDQDTRLGGKATNLLALVRLGQPVPPLFVVTTEAFARALAEADLTGRIEERLDGLDGDDQVQLREVATEIRGWIESIEVPEDVRATVTEALGAAGLRSAHVAVRSSAADEDSAGQSFAGMHESFLFVKGPEAVIEAVKGVWASAYHERALAYRRQQKISLESIAVAVVVQAMIDADRSGVMFTCDPASGSAARIVVSALYGAGEGLVGGGLDADTYTVDKATLEVTAEIVEKTEKLVLDRKQGSGLTTAPVPKKHRGASSLEDDEVLAVARAGLAIERHFRRPQDIEFCFDRQGRLHILQSRPVSNAPEYGPAAGHRLVWDNSNIIESYSGVTSPMTFSFIRRAYTIVYHCFAEVMGIPRRVVRANQRTFENMLGLFRGNVYYNLRNWYRLVRLFPGYEYNRRFMESMMGVKEPLEDDEAAPPPGRLRRYLVGLPGVVRLVTRTGWNFLRIRWITGRFQSRFRRHYERWSALDLDAMTPAELMNLYYDMEDKLLWNWKAPIINDFYVMIHYGALKKLCASWCGDETGSLQNDLICGEGGMESAEPARMLIRVAAIARDEPDLRQVILETALEEIPGAVDALPGHGEFKALFAEYLDRYGFRCPNELKLEAYSFRDRPHLVYQTIRNYLNVEDPAALDLTAMQAREQFVRREAEIKALAPLRKSWRQWPKRIVFGRVLAAARRGVKNRENMRFARTRIYGLLRELIRALGRQFAAEGLLADPEDVFYLTIDEVWDFVKGTTVTTDLAALAALRRAEFDAYREADPPDDRFETFGMAYHRNRFQAPPESVTVDGDAGSLRGIGCCPGEVEAEVRVVRSPDQQVDLAGHILVAERTDPGWVTIYPVARGILVERGSLLSHSAVVAREMGIPTIVGIRGLCRAVTDGQRVRMDGRAGTVELL